MDGRQHRFASESGQSSTEYLMVVGLMAAVVVVVFVRVFWTPVKAASLQWVQRVTCAVTFDGTEDCGNHTAAAPTCTTTEVTTERNGVSATTETMTCTQ